MLKIFKKVATVLFVAMIVTVGLDAPIAKAAGVNVTIHVQDGAKWGSMNVYNWGDAGETAGVWPGAAMEAESDGWYTYTFTTEVDLNLVFSAADGSAQSNNIDGVSNSNDEYWIVIGGEGEENDLGVKGAQAVLYEEPEEGWPVVASKAETTETVKDTEVVKDNTPATGDTSLIIPVAIVGFGAIIVIMASFKKKNIQR
jgi:hypothetical protein